MPRIRKYICLFIVLAAVAVVLNILDMIISNTETKSVSKSSIPESADIVKSTTVYPTDPQTETNTPTAANTVEAQPTVTRSTLADVIEEVIMDFNYSSPSAVSLLEESVLKLLVELQNEHTDVIDDTTSVDRIRAHIVSSYHSGSSFTANILKAHPKVYYLFEPLLFIDMTSTWFGPRNNQHLYSKYLGQMLNCQFEGIMKMSFKLFGNAAQSIIDRRHQFLLTNFHKPVKTDDQKAIMKQMEKFSALCASDYDSTIAKTVRLYRIVFALPLILRGVKTIQLVRDPRGLFYSRFNMGSLDPMPNIKQDMPYLQIKHECDNNERNVHFLESLSQVAFMRHILEENYRMARYEDFAYNTLAMSQKLYNFVNLKMTPEARNKIIKMSSSPSNARNYLKGSSKHIVSDQSLAIATKWRTKLPLHWIRRIEDTCSNVTFTTLKYNGLATGDAYLDITQPTFLSLTDPLCLK